MVAPRVQTENINTIPRMPKINQNPAVGSSIGRQQDAADLRLTSSLQSFATEVQAKVVPVAQQPNRIDLQEQLRVVAPPHTQPPLSTRGMPSGLSESVWAGVSLGVADVVFGVAVVVAVVVADVLCGAAAGGERAASGLAP